MQDNWNITTKEAEEIAALGYEDPGYFCRTFLPHWFGLPMPWLHRGILAVLTGKTDWLLKFGEEEWPDGKGVWDEKGLDKILRHFVHREIPEDMKSATIPIFTAERNLEGKIVRLHLLVSDKTLLIIPRGFSKTTLVNATSIRRIVYHDTEFLVYLSEAATHSEQQLENVKRELETNTGLIKVFGEKKPSRSASEHWQQGEIETTDNVVVVAKGRGGQVRGLNHNGKRPQDIIFDDIEDKESVATEPQRDKARTWLKADVEPALPQINSGKKRGRIIGLGTVIHHESLLLSLARDPEWMTIRFGTVDPDGDMIWEHYMTKAQFLAKRRSYQRIGKLADFNMEYQSSTKSEGENQKFPSIFIYRPENHLEFPGRAIVCDPAISGNKDSDFCAFGVVGMTPKGIVHVMDCYMERGMTPRQQVDKFFELHFKWDCTHHGVEAIAYQQALIHLLREEMFRKGKVHGPKAYFQIEPIKHGKTAKIARVEGVLSPRYTAGYVTHQRRFPDLEEQMLDWPNGKKDGPDVIAMAVTLLDPFAAWASDPEGEEEDKLAKDQYPSLDEELGYGWRAAP